MKIGYIGLGTMGQRIAVHLAKNKKLTVYNRTIAKAKWFANNFNSKCVSSIKELCDQSNIIFLCLQNDQAVTGVMKEIFEHAKIGTIIIDNSTIDHQLAIKLYSQAKNIKINYLDAPINAGRKEAEQGELASSVGGDEDIFNKVKHLIKLYSNSVTYMGQAGNGQLTKITNLIVAFGIKQGLIEGLQFANTFGLDRKKLVEVLLNGSSASHQAQRHAESIVKNELKEKIITPGTIETAQLALKNIKSKKLRLHCTELFAKITNK